MGRGRGRGIGRGREGVRGEYVFTIFFIRHVYDEEIYPKFKKSDSSSLHSRKRKSNKELIPASYFNKQISKEIGSTTKYFKKNILNLTTTKKILNHNDPKLSQPFLTKIKPQKTKILIFLTQTLQNWHKT